MQAWEKNLNALIAIILACVLIGGFGVQLFKKEMPCPLCYLQRLGMFGVATGALMNIRFGVKTSHYGLCILAACTGGFVSLRHISLHVCPGFPEHGTPMWGLSLYTWAFIVFASSVAFIALLLLIFDKRKIEENPSRPNGFGILAFSIIFLLSIANIIAVLFQCGLGPCTG